MLEIQRKVEKKMEKKKIVLILYFDGRSTLAFVLWAANTGSLKVSAKQLFSGLFVAYDENVATIYDLRFPRIFIAMAGGAATAVSGVLLQAVMKNPLADPGIIGVSSGASHYGSTAYGILSVIVLFHTGGGIFRRSCRIFSGICAVVEGRFIAASHYLSRCGGQCNVYGTDECI